MNRDSDDFRSKIDSLLERPPPDVLYHYTGLVGLKGIVETRKLWASKIQHLNDSSELTLALELARDELTVRANTATDDRTKKVTYILSAALENLTNVNIFVACFSEIDDQLSQWRGYTPAGAGYSLGFASEVLKKAADRSKLFFLAPCLYHDEDQRELIREVVDEGIAKLLRHPTGTQQKWIAGLDFTQALLFVAPMIKNAAFSEEREWRLFSMPVDRETEPFQHRPGPGRLIPTFHLDLRDPDLSGLLRIQHIVVGPTAHPDLAEEALESFLRIQAVEDWSISRSEVPYRDW